MQTRRILDEARRRDATIVASGGLDELDVERLLDDGAPIDTFGIGTKMGVSADAPSLDTAYKLVEYAGRPVMKLSAGKQTRPGPKQVYRGDVIEDDVLTGRAEPGRRGTTPLLVEVMRVLARTRPREDLAIAAHRLAEDLTRLPLWSSILHGPTAPHVHVSERLEHLTLEVAESRRWRRR